MVVSPCPELISCRRLDFRAGTDDDAFAPASMTASEKALAVVLIPARDEAATIAQVVKGCRQAGFAVWVMDDASRDDTAFLAREADAEVITVAGPEHGKTAALHAGLRQVSSAVEWIFLLDGDGQHHSADLERFWNLRHRADLIVGDRFSDSGRMPFLRRWTNRIMSRVLRRSGIRDSQCGFRLVRRAWLGDWLPRGHHFQFETEVALRAGRQPTRVVNLPIAALYAAERSKIRVWRDALNFFRCLISHRTRFSHERNC